MFHGCLCKLQSWLVNKSTIFGCLWVEVEVEPVHRCLWISRIETSKVSKKRDFCLLEQRLILWFCRPSTAPVVLSATSYDQIQCDGRPTTATVVVWRPVLTFFSSSGRGTGLLKRNWNQSSCQHTRTANHLCFLQLDSIRHASPTVIEEKDINQPTNQVKLGPTPLRQHM